MQLSRYGIVLPLHIIVIGLSNFSRAEDNNALPSGHLHRIGNQSPIRRGEIEEYDTMMSGTAFYRDFLMPAKPVVFRGVLRHSQAYQRWKNVTYLKDIYGSVRGMVDHRKVWSRGGVESPPRSVMNFSDFLERFGTEPLYWDHMIPHQHDIMRDLAFPIALNCEETKSSIHYSNLMINSGGTSYVFHHDLPDNFFHLISGEKTWLIANRSFSEEAYIGEGVEVPSLSPIDPDSVDLLKYPKFSRIEFHEIELHAGDILYVPREWVHYVRSYGTPNIGVNIWFGMERIVKKFPEIPKCGKQIRSANSLFASTEI